MARSRASSEQEIKDMFFKFSKVLLELSTERETSLKRKDYEMLLKTVVDNVSFIHSGSVLFKDEEGIFSYIAAYNHDYKLLDKIRFEEHEIIMRRFKHVYVIKRRSLDLIKELSNKVGEINESLRESVKSIENIKSFVSIPIRVQRKIIGFFNLDSWESEDIFEEKNFLPVAEMIADLLSLSVERFELIRTVKEKYEELNRVSLIDPITFLPNAKALGSYFERYVAIAKRESSNLYLMRVRIENFDDIVKNKGVEFGNVVLKKVAKVLTKILRKSDLITSLRSGSFAILSISKDTPQSLLNRIQDYVDVIEKNVGTNLEISLGLSEYGKDGKDLDSLLISSESRTYQRTPSKRQEVRAIEK